MNMHVLQQVGVGNANTCALFLLLFECNQCVYLTVDTHTEYIMYIWTNTWYTGPDDYVSTVIDVVESISRILYLSTAFSWHTEL